MGFAGSHIYVTDGVTAFDFCSYSLRSNRLIHHTNGWSNNSASGWTCRIEPVDFDILNMVDLNQLKFLAPDQYLHDPIARAVAFIGRIDLIKSTARARATRTAK
ncbi:MAG: hypothetical protein ACI8Q6_000339 [Granulosicoccus sp.]